MQRTLIAIAAIAALSPSFVHAQSSSGPVGVEESYLRFGGSIDTWIRRDSGAPSGPTWSVGPGGARSSRLIFSIKEGISSNLSATAYLEGGLSADTGAGANAPPSIVPTTAFTFGRTAHVGIGHDSWGYITLGRQYTPIQAVTAGPINDPFAGGFVGGITPIYSKNTSASNTIAYSYGNGAEAMSRPAPRNGLASSVFYSFSEETAPLSDAGKQYGFNVSYGWPSWWAGYAYHRQVGNSPQIAPAAPTAETPKTTVQFLGAAYEIGRVRVSVGLNTGRNDIGTLNRRNWSLGVNAGVGERGTIRFLHGRANDLTPTNGDFRTTQISYMYDLSKRTALYVAWGNLDNSASTAVTLSGAIGTINRGETANSLGMGIRHSF